MPSAPDRRETERIRRRMQVLIRITARPGIFRAGITVAARRLTPEEARILTDLEASGMDVIQLREVLRGAHVLVDDPELYDAWRAFKRSRTRISSHHRTVDKTRYPDIGLKGPLVREKLHGRTAAGTWVQLEKTPASMGGKNLPLPTWTDVQHLWDYVVYRIRQQQRRSVGALAADREAPDVPVALPARDRPAAGGGERGGRGRPGADRGGRRRHVGVTRPGAALPTARARERLCWRSRSAPVRARGAGCSAARTSGSRRRRRDIARTQLSRQDDSAPTWQLPEPGSTRRESLAAGERELAFAVRVAARERRHQTTPGASDELIEAVVELVHTGPVPLGAYTLAELEAVNGTVALLEREPPPELVAEAVRSLAARDLVTTEPGADTIQVRGDLGIAIAFQERSKVVVDARLTGSEPDEPWRFLLMPQPEDVTLEVLIDALGIHFYALRTTEEAASRLRERLPAGDRGPHDADSDATIAASPHTALVSVMRWEGDGSPRRPTSRSRTATARSTFSCATPTQPGSWSPRASTPTRCTRWSPKFADPRPRGDG